MNLDIYKNAPAVNFYKRVYTKVHFNVVKVEDILVEIGVMYF